MNHFRFQASIWLEKKLAKLSPVRVENTLRGGATVQYIAVPLGLLKIG